MGERPIDEDDGRPFLGGRAFTGGWPDDDDDGGWPLGGGGVPGPTGEGGPPTSVLFGDAGLFFNGGNSSRFRWRLVVVPSVTIPGDVGTGGLGRADAVV